MKGETTEKKIFVLQENQKILCKQCGCHVLGIIARGHHCHMCSPVIGTRVRLKTMNNASGQVIKKSNELDYYDVRMKDGEVAENVWILEMEIIE